MAMRLASNFGRDRRRQHTVRAMACTLLALSLLPATITRAESAVQAASELPSDSAISALEEVQKLINNGEPEVAAQAAQSLIKTLTSGHAIGCGTTDELRFVAASAQRHKTAAPLLARLTTQAQLCGGRLQARALDFETDVLLDAGEFGAAYEKAKLSVTLWENAASGSLEHAEAMSNASVLAIRLSCPFRVCVEHRR